MWPGIREITHIMQPVDTLKFKQGQVAIIYARRGEANLFPVAIGRMAANFDSTEQDWQSKGKCVIIEHHIFDELWNMGDKKIPEGVDIAADEGQDEAE